MVQDNSAGARQRGAPHGPLYPTLSRGLTLAATHRCARATALPFSTCARATILPFSDRPDAHTPHTPAPTRVPLSRLSHASPLSLPSSLPAFQVDDRLAGEGTGKVLGVGGLEGWAIPIVFGLVWSLYYAATRELGGDKGDDSGLTL